MPRKSKKRKLVVTLPVEWRGSVLECALPNRRIGIGGYVMDERNGYYPWTAASLRPPHPKRTATEMAARRAVEKTLGVSRLG